MHDYGCYSASTGRRHNKMSIIIDLFVLAYLTAIVLAICLGVLWVLTLLFDAEWKVGKGVDNWMHRYF